MGSLIAKIKSALLPLFSLKGGVWTLGKLSLVATALIAKQIAVAFEENSTFTFAKRQSLNDASLDSNKREVPFKEYEVIISRNIFGKSSVIAQPKKEIKPKQPLSLKLVGTNVSTGAKPFAIIENTKKSEQDVFDQGSEVFGQGKVIEVLNRSVKIDRGGVVETLELEEEAEGGSGGVETTNEEGTEFTVPESELNEALANLPRLLSQARAVPYFRNGQSIGMRLFAIRMGSMYEKLGLRNGDILTAVNDNSLSDPSQALKLFEQLKSERSINVKVERNGQEMTLSYTIN